MPTNTRVRARTHTYARTHGHAGFINPVTKEFPRITAAFCIDATATWIGALLGIPPLTTYIESATGIREGGRTGITALAVGFYFFLAMFFTPVSHHHHHHHRHCSISFNGFAAFSSSQCASRR